MTDYERGLNAYKNKDYKAAIDIFLLLANQGHADSQYKLGQIHECIYWGDTVGSFINGKVSEPEICENEFADNKLAFKWYQKSAKQDHAEAQYSLAFLSYFMLGDSESENEESVYWCKRAANQGHAESQSRLGTFYEFGVPGVIEENDYLAWEWYKKSAEQGWYEGRSQSCFVNLTNIAERFIEEDDEDKQKLILDFFFEWDEYENGHVKNILAEIYHYGLAGTMPDPKKAMNLYKDAIAAGPVTAVSDAQWSLANLCFEEDEFDIKAGLVWATKAAQNNPMINFKLANHYKSGWLIEQNYKKAINLYKKCSESSAFGVYESDYELAKIYRDSKYGELDYAGSFKYCKKAAESGGYSEIGKKAQYLLAEMYLKGEGTEQNFKEACKWYKEVIKHAEVFPEGY